jgi:signal transduction histidine kinase
MADRGRRKLALRPRRAATTAERPPWPVLVVDDDPQVHDMTATLLRDFMFDGRSFDMIPATSASEAAQILAGRPDIPVVLLDVVMETHDAGLTLVRYIREVLDNRRIRIILRTGQPGEAPEREVITGWDVNDYKSKTELTAQKLFSALVGAVRAWRDIITIEHLNAELTDANALLEARVAARTAELEASRDELTRAKERTEAALARETEAKRRQRQFLSMVSHEFRTPLAIIDSAAQMLMMRANGDGTATRLDSIRGSVQRLIGLIDTCLADEQLENGTITLDERPFSLADMLNAVVAAQRAANPQRLITLDLGELPPAWGDQRMLGLAVGNLVGNAVKYSSEPAQVTVSASVDLDGLLVRVADRGIGVPKDDLPRIFERFHRAANTQGIPGSGIGLHMVRQIVDLHRGSVEVDSRVGRGTIFTLRLPRAHV